MSSLSKHITDKNVILVGPAEYLSGSGFGEWIDSFDTVVRLNWGTSSAQIQPQDYGRRCDVLYKRLLKLGRLDDVEKSDWKAAGVKHVVAIARNQSADVRLLKERIGNIPYSVEWATRQRLRREMHCSPLVGMIAIDHILQQKPKSLTITGCDFYATGYHDGYGGWKYRQSMNRKEGTPGKRHEIPKHLAHMRALMETDKRIVPDETLRNIIMAYRSDQGREVKPKGAFARPRGRRRPGQLPVLGVIPARYESSRLPGKPLVTIAGQPLILWTCQAASEALEEMVVATDDERIATVVRDAGYEAVMTQAGHPTGTDRVAEVARRMDAKVYVNVQGDEPLVTVEQIAQVVEAAHRGAPAVTVGVSEMRGSGENPSVVKVVTNRSSRLLYASRAPIPGRKDGKLGGSYLAHRGIYAYGKRDLERYARVGRGRLEEIEDVEILRFLEIGIAVHTVGIPAGGVSVDTPEDVEEAERLLRQHIEAVPA
ncbi:MAG: 3-deoxy-manno-octulosonate cytidylyltransferase [Myxococcota bacterium]